MFGCLSEPHLLPLVLYTPSSLLALSLVFAVFASLARSLAWSVTTGLTFERKRENRRRLVGWALTLIFLPSLPRSLPRDKSRAAICWGLYCYRIPNVEKALLRGKTGKGVDSPRLQVFRGLLRFYERGVHLDKFVKQDAERLGEGGRRRRREKGVGSVEGCEAWLAPLCQTLTKRWGQLLQWDAIILPTCATRREVKNSRFIHRWLILSSAVRLLVFVHCLESGSKVSFRRGQMVPSGNLRKNL